MRIIIIAALTLSIIYYLTWYRKKNDGDNNIIMITVIAIILVPTIYAETRYQITETNLTQIVKTISKNKNGNIHCQRLSETYFNASQNLGQVNSTQPNTAMLSYQTCQDLFSYINSPKNEPTIQEIQAVHVLTHESIHVSGDYNESSTECKAVQYNAKTAKLLGATTINSQKLAEKYYTTMYPNLRKNYITEECAENKELDQTPNDDQFP